MKMIKVLTAGLLASTALTSAALAGGSIKDAPAADTRKLSFSVNLGATTDYVFRGFSQSDEKLAVQGGADLTYGILYAGIWSSMVDFGNNDAAAPEKYVNAEVDFYAGIKPVWGPLNFDFGVIYYAYPGNNQNKPVFDDPNYVELKAGVSGSPVKNLTLGATVFYSPEYQNNSGTVWTVEGTAGYELAKIGPVVPTLSGTVGTSVFENKTKAAQWSTVMANDSVDSYVYWNAGLALAVDKFTFDFRYWDTDLGRCTNTVTQQCDERFVFSAKITLP
jgi:uncharacterized protein (TIGR02001 family)